jgi:amino acid transporter
MSACRCDRHISQQRERGSAMLDDLFSDILGDMVFGRDPSKRTPAVIRVLFGLLGVFLSIAGLVKTASYDAGLAFRLAGVFMFLMLACFCGLNIVLRPKWKWPGRGLLLSLPALFVVRIIFGA